MSFLKRLFGGGGEKEPAAAEAVEYNGYLITARPKRGDNGQFLTAGTIAKDFPEGRKEHVFIRADTHASEEEAKRFSVQKAQRIIDEQGDRIFR